MEGDLVDDCEFWLPPQFLTDDDFLMEFKQSTGNEANKFSGFGGAIGFNSGLSSPVESVVTETESDEDDYITMLTRKMAHSTLDEHGYRYEASKGWGLSGSPKSPLCNGLGGSRFSYGSGHCSPRSCSKVSCTPGLKQNEPAWDLLCAAAREVSRMKMVEESAGLYPTGNGLPIPHVKPSPVSLPLENSGRNLGLSSNQLRLSCQNLQAAWLEQLRRHQLMEQHNQQQVNGGLGPGKSGCGHHLYHPNLNLQKPQSTVRNGVGLRMSAWPSLQQSQPQPPPQHPSGSGMRAVFLGNPGAKRECAGTGVFLPRRVGSPAETRKKKPACSTVLLPDRVVQALNLNLDAIDSQPQAHPKRSSSFVPDYDAGLKYKQNLLRAQQRQSTASVRPQPLMNHQELRLPQEWTY